MSRMIICFLLVLASIGTHNFGERYVWIAHIENFLIAGERDNDFIRIWLPSWSVFMEERSFLLPIEMSHLGIGWSWIIYLNAMIDERNLYVHYQTLKNQDYTQLWGWVTFNYVWKESERGRKDTNIKLICSFTLGTIQKGSRLNEKHILIRCSTCWYDRGN